MNTPAELQIGFLVERFGPNIPTHILGKPLGYAALERSLEAVHIFRLAQAYQDSDNWKAFSGPDRNLALKLNVGALKHGK